MILIIGFLLVAAGNCRFRFKLFHQNLCASDAPLRGLQYTVVIPHAASCFLQPALEVTPLFLVLVLEDLSSLLLGQLLSSSEDGFHHLCGFLRFRKGRWVDEAINLPEFFSDLFV